MCLLELLKQRQVLQCSILKELDDEVVGIKVAAEYMVECATNIKGQGYSNFMSAREDFITKIDKLHDQLGVSIDLNCKR